MTNLPSFFTTAGLKVPADSNPLPLGETMGSWQSRAHFPSGKAYGAAAMATMFVILRTLLFTSGLDRTESFHDESPVANRQTTPASIFRQQPHECLAWNLERVADGFSFFTQTHLGFLRWRNGDLRGPRGSRRVVQDEIELARGELVGTGGVEQIEIDQHQLTVVDMPESLEHKIHPQRFAGTVDFLTDVSGHAAEFQGSEVFEWNKS